MRRSALPPRSATGVGRLPVDDRSWSAQMHDPGPWHRPAVYWFWHGIPDRVQIQRQLQEMVQAGIHSFLIQARTAFPRDEYLSADHLDALRFAVETAADRRLVVGIYDDYNWQSGHAAGRTVADHAGMREAHLFWTTGVVVDGRVDLSISGITSATQSLGAPGMDWHYDGSVVTWADWDIAFLLAHDGTGQHEITGAPSDITAGVDGCAITVALPHELDQSTVTAFVSARCATSRIINMLDRRAVDRFVEVGYQPYATALGEHLGTTVTHLFFDQPHANVYDWDQLGGLVGCSIPFHADLAHLIRATWDDPAMVLGAVLGGQDPDSRALRCQFFEVYSTFAIATFFGPLRDWASAHGLLLTGHEVLPHVGGWRLDSAFSTWDLRVNFGLDHFGIDRYRDLTAADAQDSRPQLSAKMGDSVARANGRSRTIVEQYWASPDVAGTDPTTAAFTGHWGLTLEELRAQTIRHHFQGMRQLLLHGFGQTDGFDNDPRSLANPRFDFPPLLNFQPWFPRHHQDFAIESARLSVFLDELDMPVDVAVLYPLRTIWADSQHGDHARQAGAWYEALTASGLGWLIIDERQLRRAHPADGRLKIDDWACRTLVLPGVGILESADTMAVIAAAVQVGVVVTATGATPSVYQRGGASAAAQWADIAGNGRITWRAQPPGVDDIAKLLAEPTVEAITVDASGRRPWSIVGRTGSDLRVALFNDGHDAIEVSLNVPGGPWGVKDWSSAAVNHHLVNGVDSRIELHLDPMELRMLVLSPLSVSDVTAVQTDTTFQETQWSPPEELTHGWRLAIPVDAHAYGGTDQAIRVTAGWQAQELPDFGGTATYHRDIHLGFPQALLLELPAVAGGVEVTWNGRWIGTRAWLPHRYHIEADHTEAGDNRLEITVTGAAANRYYAGTGMRSISEPAGLLAPPQLRRLTRPTNGRSTLQRKTDAQGY